MLAQLDSSTQYMTRQTEADKGSLYKRAGATQVRTIRSRTDNDTQVKMINNLHKGKTNSTHNSKQETELPN